MQSCVKCKGNEREMNLLPGPVLYTILEREGKLRKKKKRRAVWTGQKTDSFISLRFCFIFL
jgi:hypothetical protein